MIGVQITGLGRYVPGRPLSHDDVMEKTSGTYDKELFESKTGIHTRYNARLSGLSETAADFTEKAMKEAITDAKLEVDCIDAFIVGTDTPEFISPATAVLVQGRIQGKERSGCAFDINSSCASFTTALQTAVALLQSNPDWQHIAVAGVYNMTNFLKNTDTFSAALFADGAAAFIVSKTPKSKSGFLAQHSLVDGTQWDYIGVYAGAAANPLTQELLDSGKYGLELLQRLPPERNVRLWPVMVKELLKKANWNLSEVDHFVFTQINSNTITQVMELLEADLDRAVKIMQHFGYTGSACVPMAIYELYTTKKLQRGDKLITIASGAGLTVFGNAFIF